MLAALLAVVGCDSSSPDPEPYTGVIEVAFVREPGGTKALRLVAVDHYGCGDLLAVETQGTAERLEVRVKGIVRQTGVTCVVVIPAAALVPFPFTRQGTFPVEVTHTGSTDAYAYSVGVAGERLEAVRTSTTRLEALRTP